MIPPADEHLSLEVTTRCTGSCTHCFARAGMAAYSDLPVETARSAADEGFSLGYRHLHITGGEPLLWEPLFPFLDYCADAGYDSVYLNTNGSMVTRDLARALKDRVPGLALSASLQGPADIHDGFRGTGAYDAAMTGIDSALHAEIPVDIFTAVSRGLVPRLPRFAEAVFTRFPDIRELTLIQMIRVRGDAFDLSEHLLSPDDFLVMTRMAALLNLYGYRLAVLDNPLAVAAAKAMGMQWLPRNRMLHREGRITVLADGSVTIAHSSRRGFGAYRPGLLSDVLGSTEYRADTGSDTVVCPACRHREICAGAGMERPSDHYRDMDESEPYCVRVLDAAIA